MAKQDARENMHQILGRDVSGDAFRSAMTKAARCNLDWALTPQTKSGWFASNASKRAPRAYRAVG
jgi:hypothetical protein